MRSLLLAAAVIAAVASAGSQTKEPSAPVMPVLPPPPMMAVNQAAVVSPFDQVLAGDWRSEPNKARDKYRHPRETLAFFGVAPNQNVIEIWPGGGWYAEVLAPLLRDGGSYTGVIPDPAKAGDAAAQAGTARNNQKLRDLFAARSDVFGKTKLL